MKMKPSIVIADLEEYLNLFNISLSEKTRNALMEAEEFAYKCDNPVYFNLIFSKVIRHSNVIQKILIDKGSAPNLVTLILEKDYFGSIDELASYEKDNDLYSQICRRSDHEKTAVIDRAIEYCAKENRDLLENTDIFLAAMDEYERILEQDGGQWKDKELNKGCTTLSHVCGMYNKNLWIKFDDIREVLLKVKKDEKNYKVA